MTGISDYDIVQWMKVVLDLEANSLTRPSNIWCIVCKEVDTGKLFIFRDLDNENNVKAFVEFASSVDTWIGHNILDYDVPVINLLLGCSLRSYNCNFVDTLIISKMVGFSREGGHSIRQYGKEFNLPKIDFKDYTKWSQELEEYCVRDVEICNLIYHKYRRIINDVVWSRAIKLEHDFQMVVNTLHNNGFCFNSNRANVLLRSVTEELAELDSKILAAFPPKEVLIREFSPRPTKYGTINKTSVPRHLHNNIQSYSIGQVYRYTKMVEFNPASHKQLIEVLNAAGWKPEEKTRTHIEFERGPGKNKTLSGPDQERASRLSTYGWKINENNLSTLPTDAPAPARLLAKRILLESRRRTLTEWLALVDVNDGRIHGKFVGIGAWTHRMAHQEPNTANIPNEFNLNGTKKLLGKELRSLWIAPKKRLLVGVDAESIQLRIFAHYINEAEFTEAIVNGRKDNKTDPHSLNQRILGPVCTSRATAKRFVYALLLGAGIGKLSQILECDEEEAREALDRLLQRYRGFDLLKREVIPADAKRGYFTGLDGRKVPIPGDTVGERRHLCMSGYLQNGEAIVMKMACLRWHNDLVKDKAELVDFVHDEWQTECPNNMEVALRIADRQAESLRLVGEELGLKCPLAGSYWNDDKKDYTIGVNWSYTH